MGYVGYEPARKPLTSADITDSVVTSAKIVDGTIALADLSATGTASSATFLRGDNTWGSAGATAGQVIQVLSATDSTQRSTSSTSFVTASNTLSVSITPSATANKIFVIASIALSESSGNDTYISIFRGATNLGNSTSGFTSAPNSMITPSVIIAYLDSPSTTSSTTYQVYLKCESGGSINLNQSARGTRVSTITCMEIKG